MQAPSASNTVGTTLGTIVAGILGSYMNGALWVPPIAAALSLTPAGLTSLAVLGTGMITGYLVTHVAEVANLDIFLSAWWPQIQKTYPTDRNGLKVEVKSTPTISPPTDNFNQLPDNVAGHTATVVADK